MATRVSAGKRRALQERPASPRYITDEICRDFLEHLAATCNVLAAARTVGVTAAPFYRRRQADPAFAAAWREAIQAGYDRLEEALLARALEEVEFDPTAVAIELVDDRAIDGVATDDALSPADRLAKARTRRRSASATTVTGGLEGKVALIGIQVALNLLNRREAAERAGRRHSSRPRASVEQIDRELGTKLDTLARQIGEQAE